jgi:hypothetical protein
VEAAYAKHGPERYDDIGGPDGEFSEWQQV